MNRPSACISLVYPVMRTLRTLLVITGLAVLLAWSPSAATTPPPTAGLMRPSARASSAAVLTPQLTSDTAADTLRANSVLRDLKAKYRYLDGVTVTIGTTPNGEEAVAYYTEGQIVISRSHTVPIEKILAHEIWHVIDWRKDGRIDWHENLPPSNPSRYFSGIFPDRLTSGTTGPAV